MPRHRYDADPARRYLPLVALIGAAIAALVLWRIYGSGQAGGDGNGGSGARQGPPPIAVEAVAIAREPVQRGLSTVGTLRADESVVIRPEIAGRIVGIHFQEGAPVEAGASLFGLDDSILRAELREAQATVERARRTATRAQELVERKLLSRSDYDTARTELGVTQARVDSAHAQLSKTTISAPFSGVMGLREVSVGEVVSPGQALVPLVRLDPIELDFNLPESALGQAVTGAVVEVGVDAFPGESFSGEVVAVDPVIDPNSRSARVRARIANPGNRLRPGLFARVQLAGPAAAADALMVPEQALMQEGDVRYVYTVVADTAHRVEIRTGLREPGKVEVLSGLQSGDVVIIAGQTKPMMREGAPVEIVTPAAATAGPGGAAAAAAPRTD
ncbi:MAG TPA: efflux RND transporter periplasmic adaptor subunit [Xanthomonadaceae bacterium]|nr:efflux RND transporter periplasmic adaptor subunit [Xanthomonadaceae bacterium]